MANFWWPLDGQYAVWMPSWGWRETKRTGESNFRAVWKSSACACSSQLDKCEILACLIISLCVASGDNYIATVTLTDCWPANVDITTVNSVWGIPSPSPPPRCRSTLCTSVHVTQVRASSSSTEPHADADNMLNARAQCFFSGTVVGQTWGILYDNDSHWQIRTINCIVYSRNTRMYARCMPKARCLRHTSLLTHVRRKLRVTIGPACAKCKLNRRAIVLCLFVKQKNVYAN